MNLLTSYSAYELPVSEIYCNFEFNCREAITLISVEELARSIELRGLQFPITVLAKEDCIVPGGYNYKLIIGFRRFTAITKILKWTEIPAIIKKGLSEQEAAILNLLENIDRKDLNILEEARALAAIFPKDMSISKIAVSIRRHQRWCSIRISLLKMDPKIQDAAANGLITQGDIQMIASVAPESQLGVFRRIMENKEIGKLWVRKVWPVDNRPPAEEIKKRMELLVHNGLGGLAGRLLLWAAGMGLDNETIDKELQAVIDKYNKHGILLGEEILGANYIPG